jgi:hypothetical protein
MNLSLIFTFLPTEVQAQLATLDDIIDNARVPGPTTMAAASLARMDYADELEAAINEQIK